MMYNDAMGGVDLLDNAVAAYRLNIKREKLVVATIYKLSWNTNGRSMESVPDQKF